MHGIHISHEVSEGRSGSSQEREDHRRRYGNASAFPPSRSLSSSAASARLDLLEKFVGPFRIEGSQLLGYFQGGGAVTG
jgi:hypothetical protein